MELELYDIRTIDNAYYMAQQCLLQIVRCLFAFAHHMDIRNEIFYAIVHVDCIRYHSLYDNKYLRFFRAHSKEYILFLSYCIFIYV